MLETYPAGPAAVPANFTRPSPNYRTHAWFAMGGLALFVTLYFALAGWFAWTAWRLLSGAAQGGDNALWGFVAGFAAAFLAVFMLKALFFVQHRYQIDDIEITRGEQPRLFEFLHRLADDAGAPRPHRVFLSPRVNAAVFYDLSILNLIFPSKKNLEVGLALVNVLTLGELKAVLAHEFGHFAQRSMAVGRWVYVAQQIAAQIVSRRDALDKFLRGLSNTDVRIAWVGWVLSLTIWSIRSIAETLFRVVLLAQRALSREMEFQADLVAVSLTGSDALIHALHKLGPAEQAWDRAVRFGADEASAGRGVQDLFALQTQVTHRMRGILDDPGYGSVAPPPKERPAEHRLFKTSLAQAPRMWSTHPSNAEREDNAKRVYIAASLDDRSAWDSFDNVADLKARMSAHVFRGAKTTPTPLDESQNKLNEQFARAYLDRRYRGAYLGRSIARHAQRTDELYGAAPGADAVHAEIESLYPEHLAADLTRLREIEEERSALQALRDGFLQAPGGVIRHRGRELKRRELPSAIAKVDQELGEVQERVRAHDRRCRSAHLAAAKTVGRGWSEYLGGLVDVLHYAEHAEADLVDAHGAFVNVLSIVTADGRVSSKELRRLLDAGNELHAALQRVHSQAPHVQPGAALLRRVSAESWTAALGKFELPPANEQNINEWVRVIDGWVGAAAGPLSGLRFASLDELLLAESTIAEAVRSAAPPPTAPEPPRAPPSYSVLLPGKERARKRLGLWDRFQVADGAWATTARLAVAGAIVAAVLGVGGSIDQAQLEIYNGLDRPVSVAVAGTTTRVGPHSAAHVDLPLGAGGPVTTTFLDGRLLETFEPNIGRSFAHHIYNVAGAAPLVEWYAVYGDVSAIPDRRLGAIRWTRTTAEHVFHDPPQSINTQGKGGTRLVLSALGDVSPPSRVQLVGEDERAALVAVHARWESPASRELYAWLQLASGGPDFDEIVSARLADDPHDIMTMRVEQAIGSEERRHTACARQTSLAAAQPNDGDLRYLAARCVEGSAEQDRAFREAFAQFPNNGWLAYAVGYQYGAHRQWKEALAALDITRRTVPGLAEPAAADVARIRRMTIGEDATFSDLLRDSPGLRFYADVELGSAEASPDVQAYRQLHRGDVVAAVSTAAGTPAAARVLRLAAASDGAPPEVLARARTLPAEELDIAETFAMLGLELRAGAKVDSLPPLLAQMPEDEKSALLRFTRALQQRGNLAAADSQLDGLSVDTLGYAYAMGAVALGDRAPPEWRRGARRLLFAPERPFFRSTEK